MATPRMDITSFVGKLLEKDDVDALRKGVRVLAQAVMETEVSGRRCCPLRTEYRARRLSQRLPHPRVQVLPAGGLATSGLGVDTRLSASSIARITKWMIGRIGPGSSTRLPRSGRS
jgi:hypothetical protein